MTFCLCERIVQCDDLVFDEYGDRMYVVRGMILNIKEDKISTHGTLFTLVKAFCLIL